MRQVINIEVSRLSPPKPAVHYHSDTIQRIVVVQILHKIRGFCSNWMRSPLKLLDRFYNIMLVPPEEVQGTAIL